MGLNLTRHLPKVGKRYGSGGGSGGGREAPAGNLETQGDA